MMPAPARAVICPHAGYRYSGPTAAHSFRQIDPSIVKTVFILGPSHHVRLAGCAVTQVELRIVQIFNKVKFFYCFLHQCATYATPLYDLQVGSKISQDLLDTGHFEVMTIEADEDEHSLEMQLPYIAKVNKVFFNFF